MALWMPAVMSALEIIRTVKRVANPSAVRRTRKARMAELTAASQRIHDGDGCRHRDSVAPLFWRAQSERLLNLSLARAYHQAASGHVRRSAQDRHAIARRPRHAACAHLPEDARLARREKSKAAR